MPARLLRFASTFALVAVATFAVGSRAADLRPSWECLPEGTAAMVRVPQPAGFLEMLRKRTKFGTVVLGADRTRQAAKLAVEAWGRAAGQEGGFDEMQERLAKYGLGPADLEALFAGDMGMALVIQPQPDGLPPLAMTLAWVEPGEEVAGRLLAAALRLVEERPDAETPVERIDMEMAGHPVTRLGLPILQADLGDLKIDGPPDREALDRLRGELAERAREAPKVRVGTVYHFVARVGGRLLAAQTLPESPAARRRRGAADPADAERLDDADGARGVFERYLAAHAGGGDAPLADLLQAAAMRDTLPAGEPLAEAVFDPRPMLEAAGANDPQFARRLAAVGLGEVGPVAMRIAFDEGRLRQGMFVTLPAPRAGLARILDQECDAAEVPSFVTRDAVDFTQISLDLARAYRTIKEFAIGEGGDQAANMFATVELQAQGWLGLELEAMLANLGTRHWIVSYPPQVAAALERARRDREAAGGPARAPSADRAALVWKLADDGPVLQLLPKLAALARAEVVEEQGFRGLRLPTGAAIFAGQGYLVLGVGEDSLEKTLAALRNPPAGAASLRESDVPRRGAELVGLKPARIFSVGDATRTGGMFGALRDLAAGMTVDDVDDGEHEFLAGLQKLLPTADEMEGIFGVGASIVEVNDAGIAVRSAWEMPAP